VKTAISKTWRCTRGPYKRQLLFNCSKLRQKLL